MAFFSNTGSDRTSLIVAGCLSFFLSTSSPAAAQDGTPKAELQPLSQEVSAQFDQLLAEIEEQKEDIKNVEKLFGKKIGSVKIPLGKSSQYLKALQAGKPVLINAPKKIQRLAEEFTKKKALKKLIPKIIKKRRSFLRASCASRNVNTNTWRWKPQDRGWPKV